MDHIDPSPHRSTIDLRAEMDEVRAAVAAGPVVVLQLRARLSGSSWGGRTSAPHQRACREGAPGNGVLRGAVADGHHPAPGLGSLGVTVRCLQLNQCVRKQNISHWYQSPYWQMPSPRSPLRALPGVPAQSPPWSAPPPAPRRSPATQPARPVCSADLSGFPPDQ